MKPNTRESILNRMLSMSNGCIEWTGVPNQKGYGQVTFHGVRYSVHRLVWEWEKGGIPEGMFVLHKCDNPPCCNIEHLFLGTNQDNMDDMVRKGRSYKPFGNKNTLGRSLSDEHKAKIAASSRMKRPEERAKHSAAMIGNQYAKGHSHKCPSGCTCGKHNPRRR